MSSSQGDNQKKKRKFANLAMPARILLISLLLLVSVIAVSAQEGEGEIDLGEPVVLSQTRGPEGVTTVVEIPVAKDAYIASDAPSTNFGTAPSIRLGHNASDGGALRPLVQFSLASIPSTAKINAAAVRIYLFAATGGTEPMGFVGRHLVTSWSEGLVTWDSHQPEWGDVFITGEATATPLGWKEVPVTSLVREWQNGEQVNNGITVIGDERPGIERQRWYYSKDAGNGLYPRLVVDYTVPPPDNIPPDSSVEPLNTWSPESFTVNWNGTDNEGGSGIAYFDVQYRVNFGTWTDWKMHTTATSATFEGGAHNSLYQFRSRAVDHAGNVETWTGAQAETRVDGVAPTTSITPLPEYTTTSSFTINWQGTDNQSGIKYYDLQGRVNDGPWQTILDNTLRTSYRTSGHANGDEVEFRVRAVDNVGNAQPLTGAAETGTIVVLEPNAYVLPFDPMIMRPTDPVTDTFNVSWVGFTAPGTTITLYELRYRFRSEETNAVTPWTNVPLPSPTAQSVAFNGPFANDGTYEFEVRAVNSVGQSESFTGEAEAWKLIDLREPFLRQIWLPVIAVAR